MVSQKGGVPSSVQAQIHYQYVLYLGIMLFVTGVTIYEKIITGDHH